jgi:hypothetical protein
LKQLFVLGFCLLALSSCKPRIDPSALVNKDQNTIREFCECASPLAALTLMVMMADTASVNMDSLEIELDAVAATYSKCAELLTHIEHKCSGDSVYEANVIRFVKDSVPNCSMLMLGTSSSTLLVEPESPGH